MGFWDKLKNRLQMTKGQAKHEAGRATDNPDLAAKGQGDRVAGSAEKAGEQVKDAAKNIGDAVK
jgi:uncharacterized protein YjbJ (UPF0337 family)